jgi:hypothetical protein
VRLFAVLARDFEVDLRRLTARDAGRFLLHIRRKASEVRQRELDFVFS